MHKIYEKGTSALCVPSARSMTPALSSGCTPDGGGAETCGIEGRTEENQEVCRVGDGVRVAVGAGDIPSATGMGSTLGKSGELGTLTGESRNRACSLGQAQGAVCGPARHSDSLPFSPTPAPPQDAHQGSQVSDCSEPLGTEEVETAGARVAVDPLAATDGADVSAMLNQFKGLLVDWQRGQVKPSSGGWRELSVSAAFWRDLRWWREHLDTRSLAPLDGYGLRPRGGGRPRGYRCEQLGHRAGALA